MGLKFRSHLSDGFSSWSGRPVLPVRGPWFLITPPLPLNLLEPLQDRTGKRFEDLKSTRIEDKTDLPSYLVIVSQPDSPRILRARSSLPDILSSFSSDSSSSESSSSLSSGSDFLFRFAFSFTFFLRLLGPASSVGRTPRPSTGVVFIRFLVFFRGGEISWISESSPPPSLRMTRFLFCWCCPRVRAEGPPSSGCTPPAGSSLLFRLSSGCGLAPPGWPPSGSSLFFRRSSGGSWRYRFISSRFLSSLPAFLRLSSSGTDRLGAASGSLRSPCAPSSSSSSSLTSFSGFLLLSGRGVRALAGLRLLGNRLLFQLHLLPIREASVLVIQVIKKWSNGTTFRTSDF